VQITTHLKFYLHTPLGKLDTDTLSQKTSEEELHEILTFDSVVSEEGSPIPELICYAQRASSEEGSPVFSKSPFRRQVTT